MADDVMARPAPAVRARTGPPPGRLSGQWAAWGFLLAVVTYLVQQWNAIMATAVIASVPATLLLILAQRYVAAGITAGAVKE